MARWQRECEGEDQKVTNLPTRFQVEAPQGGLLVTFMTLFKEEKDQHTRLKIAAQN